jgi:polyferredoxin
MLTGKQILWPSSVKTIILTAFVVATLFVWRPWCTLFCPLGAILGLLNRFSIFFLRFHPDRCRDCRLCRQMCRYGGQSGGRASEQQCIRCMDCTRCDAISLDHVFSPAGDREPWHKRR